MEFSVGDSVEAVDQLGIWTKAKVVSKSDNAIVVNFLRGEPSGIGRSLPGPRSGK